MKLRTAPIISAIALLAACGGNEVQREEGGAGEAEGEVLGGSISDEMLPLDTVKSQSPTLRASPNAPEGVSEEPADSETSEATEPAAPAEPTALPAEEEG